MDSKRLKELREARGFSKEELAMRLGVTPSYIEAWENGQTIPPETKARIAELFELDSIEAESGGLSQEDSQPDFKASGMAAYKWSLLRNGYRFCFQVQSNLALAILGLWLLFIVLQDVFNWSGIWVESMFTLVLVGEVIWWVAIALVINSRVSRTYGTQQNGIIRYRFYSDHMIIANSSVNLTKRYDEIKKTYQNSDFLFLRFGPDVYPLAKNSLGSDERDFIFRQLGIKKNIKTGSAVRTGLIALFILTLFTIILAFIALEIAKQFTPLPDFDLTDLELRWIYWLFIPLPLISVLLGFIYRHKGVRCIKNILGGFFVIIFLFDNGFACLDVDVSHDMAYVDSLNMVLPITLPTEGYISCQYEPESNIVSYAMIKFDSPGAILEMIYSDPNWKNEPILDRSVIPYSYYRKIRRYDYFYIYGGSSDYTASSRDFYYLAYDVSKNVFFSLNFIYYPSNLF